MAIATLPRTPEAEPPGAPPRLPAALSPLLRRVIDDDGLLGTLADGFGSPLNVLLPQQLAVNATAARRGFAGHPGLRYRIFLAHKPNRSAAVVRQAVVEGLDLDVASEGELRSGLAAGFPGARIEATGPKNEAFLRLAVQHGVLVNADSAAELHTLATIRRGLGGDAPVDVVVRVGGLADTGLDTKFGLPVRDVPSVLAWLRERPELLRLRGFAFHEPVSGGRERARAAEVLVDLHVAALRLGLAPDVLNVGGGFRVSYLERADDWDGYVSAVKAGLLGRGPSLTWNGAGFGLGVDDGRITGAAQLARFVHSEAIDAELRTFLDTPLRGHGGRALGTFLAENLVEVHIEPGRALYDQLGLTVARVNGVKATPGGEQLVGLDLNRSNLDGADREFFVDPVVVHRASSSAATGEQAAVYFGGNLCLPGDLVTRRKVALDRLPDTGDLVVFPNTAGYFMDFTESETLLQRTAAKVAVRVDDDEPRWCRDQDYLPQLPGGTP